MSILRYKSTFIYFLFLFMALSFYGYTENNQPQIESIHQGIKKLDPAKWTCRKHKTFQYFLLTEDFINSLIEIPTSNISGGSSTISSKYIAGRTSIYNERGEKVGTCSASFLCMQNQDGIFTDISNYLTVNNGLVISWFTPSTLINLELDSIVRSMVTECIVKASTKIGFNPFYGKTFNMIVSSDSTKIYFQLTEIH